MVRAFYGWAVGLLSWRVKRVLRHWARTSPTRREYAYRGLEKWLVEAAKHWLLRSATIFGLFGVLAVAVVIAQPHLPSYRGNVVNPEELIDYFNGLWAAQFTIVGLLYPIVLSLVGISLQRRPNANTRLHIYLITSGAVFTGSSSLFLVMFMALQYLALPLVGAPVLFSWILANGAWFVVNLAGTSWFLRKTILHMEPARQGQDALRYTVNEIWPAECERRMMQTLPSIAVKLGWLPTSKKDESDAASRIWLTPSHSMGELALEMNHPRPMALTDIRFRLLKVAAASWLSRADAHPVSNKSFPSQRPLLVLPLVVGHDYDGATVVCRTDTIPLTRVEKWLVRNSYVWRSGTRQAGSLGVIDVLSEQKDEVRVAIANREDARFEAALSELETLHAALVRASHFRNEAGQHDDMTRLPDQPSMFMTEAHEEWVRLYYPLFESAMRELPGSDQFVERLFYSATRLFPRMKGVGRRVRGRVLWLPPMLFGRLGHWWARSVEKQGAFEHDACRPAILKPPLLETHSRLLRVFVGMWGTFPQYYLRGPQTRQTWATYCDLAYFHTCHLEESVSMLFGAIHRGDQLAARWMLDVIQKWWQAIHMNYHDVHVRIGRQREITVSGIDGTWEEVRARYEVGSPNGDSESEMRAVFALALKNVWTDIWLVVSYALTKWDLECKAGGSLAETCLRALLKGEDVDPAERERNVEPATSGASEMLLATLRQFYCDGSYRQGYRGQLDSCVQKIESFREPEKVAGRVYVSSGADDLESLTDGFLLLLCVLAPITWDPEHRVTEFVTRLSAGQDESLRDLERLLPIWISRLDADEFKQMGRIFSGVRPDSLPRLTFEEARTAITGGLGRLLEYIKRIRTDAIAKATVSQGRLAEVAKAASRDAFARETADTPVTFFKVIVSKADVEHKRQLNFNSVNKGEYTDPELAQRAANEEVYFAETMRMHVSAVAMHFAVRAMGPEKVPTPDSARYWNVLKERAALLREAGLTPVLLLDNPTRPDWYWKWQFGEPDKGRDAPIDLKFDRRKDDKIGGYQGTINGIDVYAAYLPYGASLLCAREAFEEIRFQEFSPGIHVRADWMPSDKPALGTLEMHWGLELKILPHRAVLLEYSSAKAEDSEGQSDRDD